MNNKMEKQIGKAKWKNKTEKQNGFKDLDVPWQHWQADQQ